MCGIAGLVRFEPDPTSASSLAAAMAATLVHRGPDDSGVWASPDGAAALSHRRLSIIDLSPAGRNPMSWDGRLWITFNGEIYNFLELRKELEADGCRFHSQTDTEVVLAAYDRWGLDSVHRLVGMFAFALWDTSKRRMWLVRDRLGKKPLYYAAGPRGLSFASELKGLLADERFPRDIDADSLRLYLRYGYVPSPNTIYLHARKVPPAHYLVCENDRVAVTRYWDPLAFVGPEKSQSDADVQAECESRIATAVRQRLIADVPLGAFLSGGIDSSLVVALMQEQTTEPVQTFTVRFGNPEFNEADHAAAVARHLKTAHDEHTCGDAELFDVVDRLPEMFDEPFADSSAVPTYLVSKAARQHVTVALSGDGGDELFLGYPRYDYHTRALWALSLPRSVRRLAAFGADRLPTRRSRRIADVLRSDDVDRYARFITWWDPSAIERLTGRLPPEGALYADIASRMAAASDRHPDLLDLVSYLPEDILTKVDRASMAVSLEVRAPLLDHRVVEFALGLPMRFKQRGRSTKWLLRQLLYKRVPRALIDRPKMGFGVPLEEWFRGPLRPRMHEYCAGPDLEDLGIDPAPIRQLWADFGQHRAHRTDLLWQIYVLVAWSRRFRTARTLAAVGS